MNYQKKQCFHIALNTAQIIVFVISVDSKNNVQNPGGGQTMSEILNYVEKIKTQEQNILLKTTELEQMKEKLEMASLKLESDVRSETDIETKKLRYSNEGLRTNELKKRINAILGENLFEIRQLKTTLEEMEIELSYSRNMFSALRALLRAKEEN